MQEPQQPATPNQEPEGLTAALAKVVELGAEITELLVNVVMPPKLTMLDKPPEIVPLLVKLVIVALFTMPTKPPEILSVLVNVPIVPSL